MKTILNPKPLLASALKALLCPCLLADRPGGLTLHQQAQVRDWLTVGGVGAVGAGVWALVKAVGI